MRVRPGRVRVRERHHLRRLRAQELRVRAVSMPVRFVRVPIEVMGAADFCSAVSFVARARGASFEGERGGGCRRGEGWVPARARAV